MNCPRCKSDLIVVEFEDIELDSCPQCGGIWFDRGEMELLANKCDCAVEALSSRGEAAITEARLRCPTCRRPMEKRLFGKAEPVVGDVCAACGGLWLDAGELLQVLAQGGGEAVATGGERSPVVEYLRGTFGPRSLSRADMPGRDRRACE